MTNAETIQDLEMDIQYLEANLANGWYNGDDDKHNVQSELETLKAKLKRIK